MKLIFLTFAPLFSNAGHLARFHGELERLSELNEVSIVCFGKQPDDKQTCATYKKVSFLHFPIEFNGWKVKNSSIILKYINDLVDTICPDAVILQMEVWDLMKKLGESLKGKTKFITIVHAMPFLGSPIEPSGNFKQDVTKYINSGIDKYRRDYIREHYKESLKVFRDTFVVANNKTVRFYFNTYFKKLKVWTLSPSAVIGADRNIRSVRKLKYDFVYMARMEAGKGIEYLFQILENIASIVKRPINVAILGRTEDTFSKKSLNQLLKKASRTNFLNIDYVGWANNKDKKQILSKSGVFLYPSFYDNYPTVVNEALSFGLPCIVWDVPFSRLNYSHTKAVKRVSFLDFELFAQRAIEVLKDRNQLGKQAVDFIDSFGTLESNAKLDTAIFKKVINAHHEKIK